MNLPMLALVNVGSSDGAAHPAPGQHVTAQVTVKNTGGAAGAFTASGELVLSGTSTGEASLPAVSGIAPAGGQTTVSLQTAGGMVTFNEIGGYNTAGGLDLVLTLTNSATGQAAQYTVPSAVFLAAPAAPPPPPPPPPAPASFTVSLVNFSSNVSCGGFGSATIRITNTGTVAAGATITGTTFIPALGSNPEGYWTQQAVTVNPGATVDVNTQTAGPMQLCGYSAQARFSVVGANAIQDLTGSFNIGSAESPPPTPPPGPNPPPPPPPPNPCAAVQQQYNNLGSQIMNIRIQLAGMSSSDPSYQSLTSEWNSLSLQQSQLVSQNQSCF